VIAALGELERGQVGPGPQQRDEGIGESRQRPAQSRARGIPGQFVVHARAAISGD
jgi:hypothetical protein